MRMDMSLASFEAHRRRRRGRRPAAHGRPACPVSSNWPESTAQTNAPRNPPATSAAGGDEQHDDAHARQHPPARDQRIAAGAEADDGQRADRHQDRRGQRRQRPGQRQRQADHVVGDRDREAERSTTWRARRAKRRNAGSSASALAADHARRRPGTMHAVSSRDGDADVGGGERARRRSGRRRPSARGGLRRLRALDERQLVFGRLTEAHARAEERRPPRALAV